MHTILVMKLLFKFFHMEEPLYLPCSLLLLMFGGVDVYGGVCVCVCECVCVCVCAWGKGGGGGVGGILVSELYRYL